MNVIRLAINIALSGLLFAAGLHGLSVASFRINGWLVAGRARGLLAASLLALAGFAGAVALGWIRGSIAMPPRSSFRFDPTDVDPACKGELLVRHWYFVLPALISLVLAFAFAVQAKNKGLNQGAFPMALRGGLRQR